MPIKYVEKNNLETYPSRLNFLLLNEGYNP